MAKGKSSNSGRAGSTASAKRNATTPNNGRSSSSAKPSSSSTQRAVTSTEIGQVAGEVWGLLSRDGGQTLAAIKKSVDAPADIVVAAIGWLAREDKLEFTTSGRQIKISLR